MPFRAVGRAIWYTQRIMMTYQEALDYLYSFMDYERKPAATPEEAAFNLDRMRALLDAVGNPQDGMAGVVVAGTKGKGSTCALIESIVRAAGYRCGLWTSPHLNSYRERIQIDRLPIGQAALADGVERIRPLIDSFDVASYGSPTTFELGFALALRYFADEGVQVAVLEVGMGGRYDAANVITPLVSVISSISFDHMNVLGHTLASIADNKAGIIKPGVPAITVPQHPEAAAVLAQVARDVGAALWIAEEAWIEDWRLGSDPAAPTSNIQPPKGAYPVAPNPALLRGPFQRENARLALAAALVLRTQGLTIPDAALAEGLATAQWPGRLEVAGQAPWLVLDGAHNGDSAEKLLVALQAEFHYRRLLVVLGTSRDKDIRRIVAALAPHADALILTRARHHRAYVDLDQIAAAAQPFLHGPLLLTPDIPAALDQARSLATPDDLIVVTGSLFVVGDAREALGLAFSD